MGKLSYSQLGELLGISKQAVAKAVKAGMPVDSFEAADTWRRANLDVSRTKAARVDVSAGPSGRSVDDAGDDDAPHPSDDDAYKRARTEREQIRRDRERLELDRERGSLVDKAEVARLRFTEFRALRDSLGHIGARVKDALSVESDPLRCEQIVTNELERALSVFADQILTRGVMQDDDDEDDGDGEGGSGVD